MIKVSCKVYTVFTLSMLFVFMIIKQKVTLYPGLRGTDDL